MERVSQPGVVWEMFEKKLSELEGRLGAPVLDENPSRPTSESLDGAVLNDDKEPEIVSSVRDLVEYEKDITVLKRALKSIGDDFVAKEKEFKKQQSNIAKLVSDWEIKLQQSEREKEEFRKRLAEMAAERNKVLDEVKFLKIDNKEYKDKYTDAFARNQGLEKVLAGKDKEITRIFDRMRNLEEANKNLNEKNDFLIQIRREVAAKQEHTIKGKGFLSGFFGWLMKPLVVIETGEKGEN
ncbi:MAG: hypothetical protein JW803_07300 [Endomicrobiales bacterium]|nr:hypothetical protein [Endomicrobiales bacterium]